MSSIKALEKLREASRLDDDGWVLENGDTVFMFNREPDDPRAVNRGEAWRKIADEIEAEIAERFMELPLDADGVPIRIGDVLEMPMGNDGTMYQMTVENVIWNGTEWSVEDACAVYGVDNVCHVKPDTVESLLADFQKDTLTTQGEYAGEVIEFDEFRSELRQLVSDYDVRIRKAVEHGDRQ